jgi:hypothetical protein
MDKPDVLRSPKTELDYLKMGLPGLRQEVPEKTSGRKLKGFQKPDLGRALHRRKLSQIEEFLTANRAA